MTDKIYLWLSIDKDVQDKDFVLPTIEQQKEFFLGSIMSTDDNNNNDANEEEDEDRGYYGRSNENTGLPPGADKKIKKFHQDWIDIMSFSHNVASNPSYSRSEAHVGEITCTKFVDQYGPILSYITLKGECIRHAILRRFSFKNGKMDVLEYEMEFVQCTNVSVSGGAGGKPVETMSLSPKIYKQKIAQIDTLTMEFTEFAFHKWDKKTKKGTRTVLNKDGSHSLVHLAKQKVIEEGDIDKINTFKEMGIISIYELNEKEEMKFIITTGESPALSKFFRVQGKVTRQSIIDAIAKKINIKAEDVQALYMGSIERETDEDLDDITDLQSFSVMVNGKIL